MSSPPSASANRPARLADALRAKGDIRTRVWRDVFAAVPREVFVPCFATHETGPRGTEYRLYEGTDPAQRDAWLDLVYSDTTLITQVDERPVEEAVTAGGGVGQATSSSTAPGLMARLLEALDVHDGHDVLEIGTGTGFNAALLARRLGSEHVTTVDIDADLTAKARRRLTGLGLAPAVHTVDGRRGWPGSAPYDRIIATCSVPYLPYAWVEQTREGGRILANIAGASTGRWSWPRFVRAPRGAGSSPSGRGSCGHAPVSPRSVTSGRSTPRRAATRPPPPPSAPTFCATRGSRSCCSSPCRTCGPTGRATSTTARSPA
ncbi:methyltransferase domain-containing protein [Allosalinactinospora lopnorensis]|uniref:methyltransferase domain-containing protein n=1 Tax=Allosalinactinospora lopnorensis TaxID=1352348 RepID=UPI0009E22989|nr:methyltransferase domain-containing protein [Allosalinactinospora lopnorensis]